MPSTETESPFAPAVKAAVGSWFGIVTTTCLVVEAVAPRLSVTVSETGYEPLVAYVWDATTPDPLVPSPKFHA